MGLMVAAPSANAGQMRCSTSVRKLAAAQPHHVVRVTETSCIQRVGTQDGTHGKYRGFITTRFTGAVARLRKYEVESAIQLDQRGPDVTIKPEAFCDLA